MLVLSRKLNESIMIGGVRVVVVAICGGKVKLGIEARRDVNIVRSELLKPGEAAERKAG